MLSEQINLLVRIVLYLSDGKSRKKTSYDASSFVLSAREKRRGANVKLLAVLESRTIWGRSGNLWEIARRLGVIHEPGESLEPNPYSNCSRVGMAQNALTEVT